MLPKQCEFPLVGGAQLVSNSQAFPVLLPTRQNRISELLSRAKDDSPVLEQLWSDARSTRIIIHQRVRTLINEFLEVKIQYGMQIERNLYQRITQNEFIQRLIIKRPLSFVGSHDSTLGRDGQVVPSAARKWPLVGTEDEQAPLLLKDYLSYDEIAIAALIGVSSPTYFINSGARGNSARPGREGEFTSRGVYVGLVGPRFEIPNQMESRFLIESKFHCTAERGYGYHQKPSTHDQAILQMWGRFYNSKDPETGIFGFPVCSNTTSSSLRFDLYDRRIRLTLETFLLEAEARGREVNRSVHAFVVGLGLGVWQYDVRQKEAYLDALIATIAALPLYHVEVVEASWIADTYNGQGRMVVSSKDPNHWITVLLTRGDPAAKRGDDRLLVASYAWDGNSFPGNELWRGSLSASGDPAAVCCSTIGELQNPYVNPFWENIYTIPENN